MEHGKVAGRRLGLAWDRIRLDWACTKYCVYIDTLYRSN